MSLYYLVKLEILIAHVLLLSCYRKKTQEFISTQLYSKFVRFYNSMCKILLKKLHITRITDLELSTTPLMNGCCELMMHYPAWPTPFSVAVSVHSNQWCYFAHILFQYSTHASTGLVWQTWGYV